MFIGIILEGGAHVCCVRTNTYATTFHFLISPSWDHFKCKPKWLVIACRMGGELLALNQNTKKKQINLTPIPGNGAKNLVGVESNKLKLPL